MSTALRIYQGLLGRVALLDMDKPLVLHAHPHCHVLLKAGGADTFFGVRDSMHPLRDDTAVLVNTWEPHFYAHRPEAPRSIVFAFYIEPRWLASIERSLSSSLHPNFFPRPCVEIPTHLRRRVDRLADEMLYGDPGDLEALVFEIMMAVIDRFSEWRDLRSAIRQPSHVRDYRVRRAMRQIAEEPGQDLDTAALARSAGLSRSHFFELFRRQTQVTPQVYRNVLRMERAIDGLSRRDGTIGDLAAQLGFGDAAHFTRFFRHHQGVAPSDYRRTVELVDAGA